MRVPITAGALAALLACAPALANDRPFQANRTAVMEDDEYTWSMENWVQRFGRVRGLSIEPEYTFGGGFSIQAELTKLKDRDGRESGHEAEVEFKQVFNHIARDGYGIALSAALASGRSHESGTVRGLTLRLPVSLQLPGGGLVHLNVGAAKESGHAREWTRGIAFEREVVRRTTLFAEWALTGEQTYAQLGVRHWLRKEKLALDFSLQQFREDGGRRASGFILGLGIYDF